MDLPDVILLEIFCILESYQICYKNCSLVCKRWLELLKNPRNALRMIKMEFSTEDIGLYQQGWQYYLPLSNYLSTQKLDSSFQSLQQCQLKCACKEFFLKRDSNRLVLQMKRRMGSTYFLCRLALALGLSLPGYQVVFLVMSGRLVSNVTSQMEGYTSQFPTNLTVTSFNEFTSQKFDDISKHIILIDNESRVSTMIYEQKKAILLKNKNKMIVVNTF